MPIVETTTQTKKKRGVKNKPETWDGSCLLFTLVLSLKIAYHVSLTETKEHDTAKSFWFLLSERRAACASTLG